MPQQDALTVALAKRILTVAAGSRLFDSQIAMRCNVHPDTLRLWLVKGMLENAEEPHKSFAREYSRIQIEHEDYAASAVADAAQPPEIGPEGLAMRGDWKAAAWFLERRYPKRWNPVHQPQMGPAEAIDIEQLLRAAAQKGDSLKELFANPPPELEEALRANAETIRAFLAMLPEGKD